MNRRDFIKTTAVAAAALAIPEIVQATPKTHFPTGLPTLDSLLGGGIPKGSFGLIFGYFGSGKASLARTIRMTNSLEKTSVLYGTDTELLWIGDRKDVRYFNGELSVRFNARKTLIERWMEQAENESFEFHFDENAFYPIRINKYLQNFMESVQYTKAIGIATLTTNLDLANNGYESYYPRIVDYAADFMIRTIRHNERHFELSVIKNRFGPCAEIKVVIMNGMIHEI